MNCQWVYWKFFFFQSQASLIGLQNWYLPSLVFFIFLSKQHNVQFQNVFPTYSHYNRLVVIDPYCSCFLCRCIANNVTKDCFIEFLSILSFYLFQETNTYTNFTSFFLMQCFSTFFQVAEPLKHYWYFCGN